MPVLLPAGLPAIDVLLAEGIDARGLDRPSATPAGALRIALLNLMPDKRGTEIQIARMLGDGPYLVDLVPFATSRYMTQVRQPDYRSANTPVDHLRRFYRSFDEIRNERFDGLIVTGAPVERIPYEAVPYWSELREIFDWSLGRVAGSFNICWGAQAALGIYHNVPKHVLGSKLFGVFEHDIETESDLLDGFGPGFRVPVSRYAEVVRPEIPVSDDLVILADSAEAGLCLLEDRRLGQVYMFNHLEYDADTLKREYDRDRAKGENIVVPKHYFVDIDTGQPPEVHWRDDGRRLYQNWLRRLARKRGMVAG
ncbi:MAG: homoserine O-succinyltransferase [Pseudomonadota bacterium]|nr:homoserine O-succinyltransferase [Pseudomonadota bacterium]